VADTAAVTLLRPVRVLVAGEDVAIVAGLRDELLRLGFHAMSSNRLGGVAELAAVERVNVVILELSGGLSAVASAASAIEALPQRMSIMLAGRSRRSGIRLGYELVDPDGSVEDLAITVHRAFRGGPLRAERSS
jgi:hypothetical protein